MEKATAFMNDSEMRKELEKHHAASFMWAFHCCLRDRAEAEEVLQTVYLKILEGKAVFSGRSTFKTWLFAVIRMTAGESWRRRRLRRQKLVGFEDIRPVPSPEHPERNRERAETLEIFERALRELPLRQQQVLELVFYHDLTIEEAAEVLGISLGSSRTHYARGKRSIREKMEKLGVGHEYGTRKQ